MQSPIIVFVNKGIQLDVHFKGLALTALKLYSEDIKIYQCIIKSLNALVFQSWVVSKAYIFFLCYE